MATVPKPIAEVGNNHQPDSDENDISNGDLTDFRLALIALSASYDPTLKDSKLAIHRKIVAAHLGKLDEFKSALLALAAAQDPLGDPSLAFYRNIVYSRVTKGYDWSLLDISDLVDDDY